MKSFLKNQWVGLLAVLLLVGLLATGSIQLDPLVEQGISNFDDITLSGGLIAEDVSSTDDLTVTDDLDVDGDADIDGTANLDVVDVDGAVDFAAAITTTLGVEQVGSLPTIISTNIDIDNDSSPVTCATIGASEVWYIHSVFANVLDNFATGGSDDAVFTVGDGTDGNGYLDLVDAELQTADTEGTGATAGWQGFFSADAVGAYLLTGTGFVQPAADTIDCAFGGTGLASDTASTAADITVYIVYTRLQ